MARKSVAGTAADPTIQFETLEIDGRSYRLCYSFNAIAEAERLGNCNLLEGIAAVLFNSLTAQQARGLLYAALSVAQPEITLAEAGQMIRVDTLPGIRLALLKAYNASMPEAEKFLKDPPVGGDEKSPPESDPTLKSGANAGPSPESSSDSPPTNSSATHPASITI